MEKGNKDIDLQLVLISEYLRCSGKIPEDNDLMHMLVNGELMKVELCFIIFTEISPYLYKLENFQDLITFSISCLLVQLHVICGDGFLNSFDKFMKGGILLSEFCTL